MRESLSGAHSESVMSLPHLPGAHQICSDRTLVSWTGERNYNERLWVEIRTEGEHSAIAIMDKADSA